MRKFKLLLLVMAVFLTSCVTKESQENKENVDSIIGAITTNNLNTPYSSYRVVDNEYGVVCYVFEIAKRIECFQINSGETPRNVK